VVQPRQAVRQSAKCRHHLLKSGSFS
jgi:hypothetical protein